MAALQNQTLASPGNPLYYPVGQPIIVPSIDVSTIIASTITTDVLAVFPNATTSYTVSGVGGNLTTIETAGATSSIGNYEVIENANKSTLMYATNGIPANNGGWFQNYITTDLAGNDTLKGTIRILSSLSGAGGGVQIISEDGSYVNIGDTGSLTSFSTMSLKQDMVPATGSAYLQHLYNGNLQSQIHFQGGPGNTSSISLVSGGGQAIGVNSTGVQFNPGTNQPVTLTNGYYDVNNLALSNVSTINGNAVTTLSPVVSWVNPYGTGPTVSTLGVNTSTVAILYFSTIPGHTYEVSCEFAAGNGGGGAANDTTQLQLTNINNLGAPYGRIAFLDTWKVDQTYTSYKTSATQLFTVLANNTSGGCLLGASSQDTGGNVQIINVTEFNTRDLGIATVQY